MMFNENLKYFMECRGIQSKELSAKTNISINTINSYLKKGGSIPDVEKAFRIAKALDIPMELLITGFSLTGRKIKPPSRTNILKPQILEIESILIHFSQKDLDIISSVIKTIAEKYPQD